MQVGGCFLHQRGIMYVCHERHNPFYSCVVQRNPRVQRHDQQVAHPFRLQGRDIVERCFNRLFLQVSHVSIGANPILENVRSDG